MGDSDVSQFTSQKRLFSSKDTEGKRTRDCFFFWMSSDRTDSSQLKSTREIFDQSDQLEASPILIALKFNFKIFRHRPATNVIGRNPHSFRPSSLHTQTTTALAFTTQHQLTRTLGKITVALPAQPRGHHAQWLVRQPIIVQTPPRKTIRPIETVHCFVHGATARPIIAKV